MTINLELKNIKYIASMSEETHCYSADLYLDGRKVAEVSNHGHGGCDDVRWLSMEASGKITAYFAAQPERDTGMELDGKPFMMRDDLETWCGEFMNDYLTTREYKRTLARKVVTTDGKTEWSWKCKPADLGKVVRGKDGQPTTMRDYILKNSKEPGTVIVNDMSAEELTAHIAKMREFA